MLKIFPLGNGGKWEAFSSPEEAAFYWMLTDQLEKATEILQTLPEGSPYLREHLQRLQSDKNALEQSEETEKALGTAPKISQTKKL
jgi:hypothetical protein